LLLFFLPTCISGMVSPYAVRLLIADRASAGHLAGKLYFVSTFGSAAGTLLTSFYLVLYLEVNTILLLMLSISARHRTSGVAARALGQRVSALWLRRVRVFAVPLLLLLSSMSVTADQKLIHSEKSLYRDVFVYDNAAADGTTRCLCFTSCAPSAARPALTLKHPIGWCSSTRA
jgi:hypothetical protein